MAVFNQSILYSAAVSEGAWVDCSTFQVPFTIIVHGFAADGCDQVQIVTSNLLVQPPLAPPVAGDGTIIEGWPTINADGAYMIASPRHWIRVRKSQASSTPVVTVADLFAR